MGPRTVPNNWSFWEWAEHDLLQCGCASYHTIANIKDLSDTQETAMIQIQIRKHSQSTANSHVHRYQCQVHRVCVCAALCTHQLWFDDALLLIGRKSAITKHDLSVATNRNSREDAGTRSVANHSTNRAWNWWFRKQQNGVTCIFMCRHCRSLATISFNVMFLHTVVFGLIPQTFMNLKPESHYFLFFIVTLYCVLFLHSLHCIILCYLASWPQEWNKGFTLLYYLKLILRQF